MKPPDNPLSEYLSIDQLCAEFAGLSRGYLAKLRCVGGGPQFSKLGRNIIYNRGDVLSWIESKRRASTSEVTEPKIKAKSTAKPKQTQKAKPVQPRQQPPDPIRASVIPRPVAVAKAPTTAKTDAAPSKRKRQKSLQPDPNQLPLFAE